MSDQSAILLINATINKEQAAQVPEYLAIITPIFAKNGGQPIARFKVVEQLVGDGPEVATAVKFPSALAIQKILTSDEFKALEVLRNNVFAKLSLSIAIEM